jgi:hypothetical protein
VPARNLAGRDRLCGSTKVHHQEAPLYSP